MMNKLDAVGSSIQVQILQTAMLHSEVGEFEHYVSDHRSAKSAAFVALVLGAFMRGLGYPVPGEYTFGADGWGGTEGDKAARQLAFREKLGTQIHSLTGKKPRWEVQTDGTYAIFPE